MVNFWLPIAASIYAAVAFGFAAVAIAEGEVEKGEGPMILISALLWPLVLALALVSAIRRHGIYPPADRG